MSVETTRYGAVGKCDCGSETFYVAGMVKTHAQVYKKTEQEAADEGWPERIFVDTTDFPGNCETSDVILEHASDLIAAGHLNDLPERILEGKPGEVDLNKYVVVRCTECGRPFDYGDHVVVLD